MAIDSETDSFIRLAAFQHVQRLSETHSYLTAAELDVGFLYQGVRVPIYIPQRGIFKPKQMQYLLSIKTVFPKPGGKVWYDDQRQVHKQIYDGDETVEYAFMGDNPEAADNRWLREAMLAQIPLIYFLGIAPGRYQAILPVFIVGWDEKTLKANVAFGETKYSQNELRESHTERRYALREVKQRLHQASFREAVITA